MILFPGSKINLGLNVVSRRADGYHDIETVMVPVGWTDVLEILPPTSENVQLTCLGRTVNCPAEKNLVIKAYRAMQQRYGIAPVDIVLEKIVPDGAGLGGGSADAAATIIGLNGYFSLGLTDAEMASIAATIGADCPFFIYNRPMLATGTGTELTPIDMPALNGHTLLIIKPESVSISTAAAYSGITPAPAKEAITEIIVDDITTWHSRLKNDFERSIFPLSPGLAEIKAKLYDCGAVYAAMSGSGSSIFGIFPPDGDVLARCAADCFKDYPHYLQKFDL